MTEGTSNQKTPGSDVFVSYASPDVAIASAIVENLEQQEIRCWMAPRDVKPGTVYADAIIRAINESKALVLVLSASAVASEHVSREVERAGSKHKQIVVFRVDAVALSAELEYFLSRSQWIDVEALGMPGALAKLTDAVGRDSAPSSQTNPALGAAATQIGKRSGGVPKRVVVAVAVVVIALSAAVLAVRFWPSKHSDAQAPAIAQIADKSIAVLPFADMSQKKDQEYFGDGMAEEILDLLAKIPGLTVIGRTSSFQFKGKNEDLRTIGKALNAAYVLDGSVRNSGDQVRITAQLINTKTGAHEWSETYNRPFGDVLVLQDAIAAAVVRELQLTVASGYLESRPTLKNADAYDLILRGRHAADRWDREGLDEAATLFQKAMERDATSADAAAELASVYYKLGVDGFLTPATAFEPGRRAATAALKLDSKNAKAHTVLGQIHLVYDWDWAAAEGEFQQVATLVPGSADARAGEAHLALDLGRWDDALSKIKAALALDPLDPNSFWVLMEIEMHRGDLTEAEAANRRLLDIRPTFAFGHLYLGLVLLARGNRDAALVEMQQETIEEGKQQGLSMAYHALGRKAESDAALSQLIQKSVDKYAFEIAEVYAFRGQLDEAVQWLERPYAQKSVILNYVKGDWPLKNLEADSRYKTFLRKMNLPE